MRKSLLAFLLIGSFFLLFFKSSQNFEDYEQEIPGSEFTYRFIAIKGGEFRIGSPSSEKGRDMDEGPQKKVTVSSFWIGAFEITHDIFDVFYNDQTLARGSEVDAVTRPTTQYIDLSWGMGKSGGFPVNSMSQDAALMFCRWLYKNTGVFCRLPTEAEWEYACRAGSETSYSFGENGKDLDKYAWYSKNAKNKYHKVGEKQPNAWGLYDMYGNLSEWTLDQYDSSFYAEISEPAADPVKEPATRYPRSLRGGSYLNETKDLRSANRFYSEPEWNRRDPQMPKSRWWLTDAKDVGFRILRPLKQPAPEEAETFYKKYLGN